MSLELISKKDHIWRAYALKLTGDKNTADDLVQDMYLKIYKLEVELNDSYIFKALRFIFYDKIKRKEILCFPDHWFFDDTKELEKFEIDDNQKCIIDRFEKLPFHQKQLIIESQNKSLRQIQKEFNINYGFVHRELKKARNKLFKDEPATKG